MKTRCFILSLIASLACSTLLRAQVYTLDWSSVDSGGSSSTVGVYSLSATIGQFEASQTATVGHYSVASGFWAYPGFTSGTNPVIQGVLRFTNTSPAILDLLNAPVNEGMLSYFVTSASRPPASPITATTPEIPAASRTNTPYQITVTASTNAIAYAVTPRVALLGNAESYYFNTRTSALVVANGPPINLDFEECLGVVIIHFVNSLGNPTPVDGGQILVTGAATRRTSIPTGATEARMYLRGGTTHPLSITVNRGADPYRDRLTFALNTNVAAVCDAFTSVNMLVPEPGAATLGVIFGQVDMVGEFELTVDGANASNIPDSTGVVAMNGPFQNQRWSAIAGSHFTVPSSGLFVLTNVAPSALDPASPGYTLYAQMYFRTNRAIESFRTPALGAGSNAPLPVGVSDWIDLGNLFVINPGYLRGRLTFQGPQERLGAESLLRGLNHASDNDVNLDGVPDQLGTFGLYWSSIGVEGVNRLAPGASLTAAYGYGSADFDGAVQAGTSAFEGHYELALGGLNSQPTLWNPKNLNLVMSHPLGPTASNYYSTSLTVTDRLNREVQILAGQAASNDIAYCFSEVHLTLRSTSGTFYNPQVLVSSGSFAGTDFRNQPADYGVAVNLAAGTPNRVADAASRGEVVLLLPQGSYRLFPSVVFSGPNPGRTGLEPVDITVGCQERLFVDGCLRMEVPTTSFPASGPVTVPVLVHSCSNLVTKVTSRLNGGSVVTACTDCGVNPLLSLNLTLASGDNHLLVTATDSQGHESYLETVLRTPVGQPLLRVALVSSQSGGGAVRVSWPTNATGFILQQNYGLSPIDWTAFPGTIQNDGTNQFAIITPPVGNLYFRLLKP